MYIVAATLDDLIREAVTQVRQRGEKIKPGKGSAVELTGVMLELTNPRARLSLARTREKPFSCVGELCWYLAPSDELAFISYYIPNYGDYAEGDPVFGAYGPRMFKWNGINQIANVIELLLAREDSRRAVVQIFDATDLAREHKEVPCTCTLQFFVRNDHLHMLTNMRSNDVYSGLPHDIFSFTMLQEIIARSISVELGSYKHSVGSLHVYEEDLEPATQFIRDNFESRSAAFAEMPGMPAGDPWPSIEVLRVAEKNLRTHGKIDDLVFDSVDSYWGDLFRLLQVFRARKSGDTEIEGIRQRMVSSYYRKFIDSERSL
jgi:thymidylate synthase